MPYHRTILCLLSSTLLATPHAVADNLDQAQKALNMIQESAIKMCGETSTKHTSSSLELSGKSKAELKNLISKLMGLKIQGAAKYQTSESEGVLQKDLAGELKDTRNCRRDLFQSLQKKLVPDLSSQSGSNGNVNVGGNQTGDIKGNTGNIRIGDSFGGDKIEGDKIVKETHISGNQVNHIETNTGTINIGGIPDK